MSKLQSQLSKRWSVTAPLYWFVRRFRDFIRRMLRRVPVIGQRMICASLEQRYKNRHGLAPRLNPPVSFNEHILHRIIYDRDPRLKVICNKLAVRDFIRKHAGPEFVVPLLGVWKDPTEIDWDSLPQRFVLKPNHASGPVAIVLGDSDRNPDLLTESACNWLSYDYFDKSLEWAYLGIPRRILAEPLLTGPEGGPPTEAQVLVFFGKAAYIRVLTGKKLTPDRRDNWFDATGTRLPLCHDAIPLGDFVLSEGDVRILVPVAERVSAGFSHLRVDFYLTNDGPKIGELTPYHAGGTAMWDPPNWDEKLGRVWDCPV
jgi:hypothetical protein